MARAEDSTLIRYISEALEISDQGLKPSIEEICGERTDLVPEVLAAVEFERFLPSLQGESAIHDAHLGQTVGNRYRLDSLLGAGSMGMVYHAEDLDLRRSVAVKILRTDVLAIDEAEARFIREAEALAAVHHHSVVTIFDRGITETGALFLVTELLNGLPLSDLIEEAKQRSGAGQLEDISWMETDLGLSSISEMSYLRTVVRWIADLASGLGAAHDAGIFHRDIKPSNVLVRCDGPPVLLDFGIASLDSQATIVEREGALGTPAYMAPESLEDVPAGAPRDVYSLTATLYHLLTLRAPYSGSPSQVIATLGRRDPRPAYRLRPGLPRDLQAILDRGMCREVAGRYPSARDLEADLRAFLDYRSVSARPITSLERGWRRLRRSSAFRAGAVVALVLIGASAATSWRSNYVEAQSARALDIWKHVPPMLTLWNAADRYIADEDERQELRGLLGEVVEASVNPLPAQLYRAGFRLDHGDVKGAAADMAVIADSVDTEFARALARIYAVQASDDSGQLEITLGDLPKLDSPLDSYLAGYHMLRQATSYADYRRVEQLLQAPGLEEHAFAMDILLPVQQELVAEEKTVLGRREAARVIYSRAVRWEEGLGTRTATSAHALGWCLAAMEHYEEALAPLRDGIALAPSAHGLRINLGAAARRLQKFEEARLHLQAAIELRPNALNSYRTLARVLVELGLFDEARDVLDAAPFPNDDSGHRARLVRHAEVESSRAQFHLAGKDPDTARDLAQEALDLFESADEHGDVVINQDRILCAAIVEGDSSTVLEQLLVVMEEDPTNWRRLDYIIDLIPSSLSTQQTRSAKAYLTALREYFGQERHVNSIEAPTPPKK